MYILIIFLCAVIAVVLY